MPSQNPQQKQHKEEIEKRLEDLAETTSKHPEDDQKVQQAKDQRALAEKKLVDSRPGHNGEDH